MGVCEGCGHVQIAPVYTEYEQDQINRRTHSHFISGGNEKDSLRKREITLPRLRPFLGKQKTMLDVGSGEGWAHKIADENGMSYFVIEPMEELHERLIQSGALIAGKTIGEVTKKYDLIIFRHVLEHLIDPVGDLQKLVSCLSDDGILYLALPNFNELVGRKGYRTNSLRAVHISYFTMNKLLGVISTAGLKPLAHGEDGELWAVTVKGEGAPRIENEYATNVTRLRHQVKRNIRKDYYNIGMILARRAVRLLRQQ